MGLGDEYVRKVFNSVAPKYDVMNDVLSLGVHRCWKDYFVNDCVRPQPGSRFLDVAGGTGDIAFRIIDKLRGAGFVRQGHINPATQSTSTDGPVRPVTVLDINAEMLAAGKQRATREGYGQDIDWVEANAEVLPFPDASFDSYTVAFGIRNFSNRPKALAEAHRVLKHGGVLNILEFSHINCPLLNLGYSAYSSFFIPTAGQIIAGDRESYQYLVDSIRAFPTQEEFAKTIQNAGFGFVRYQNLLDGVACIHTAVKTVAPTQAPTQVGGPGPQPKQAEPTVTGKDGKPASV
jgi:2-methoxy-6-polyprenyl-1,4-benzoquinol methylase